MSIRMDSIMWKSGWVYVCLCAYETHIGGVCNAMPSASIKCGIDELHSAPAVAFAMDISMGKGIVAKSLF